MENVTWIMTLQACVPILVALVGIIPTIVANRKKTQSSIDEMQNKLIEDINQTRTAVKNVQTKMDEHLEEEEEHRPGTESSGSTMNSAKTDATARVTLKIFSMTLIFIRTMPVPIRDSRTAGGRKQWSTSAKPITRLRPRVGF